MAFIFSDGFDNYTTATELLYKWKTNVSTCTVQTTGSRFGAGSVRFTDTAAALKSSIPVPTDDIFFNFAFYPRAYPSSTVTIFGLLDSAGNSANLRLDTTGHLIMTARGTTTALAGGTGAGQILLSQWNYVSGYFKGVNAGTGRAKLYLNGSLQFDLTLDTISTGNVDSTDFYLQGIRTGAGNEVDYDDILIYDDTGAFMNTQISTDFKIETLRPTGDNGAQQWTPSAAVDHYTLVDESAGPDTANYIDGVAAGDRDLFDLANPVTTATTIHAVVVNAVARRTDTGAINLKPFLRNTATDDISANQAVGSTISTYQHPVYQNPNGPAAWDAAGLNGSLIGVQVGT